MINLVKLEIYKLKRSKPFILISVILIIAELSNVIKSGSIVGNRAFASSIWDIVTTMLFGSIFAGIFVGTDFMNRTINRQIEFGHSRLNILVSKGIVLFLATEIIMLLYPITSVIVNTTLNGCGEAFTITTIVYIIRTIFLRMILDISCLSLWIFLAFLFKDVAKTMGASILMSIFGSAILLALSEKSDLLKVIYNFTVHCQARIIVNKVLTFTQVSGILISNLIVTTILLGASYLVFRKVELK